MSSPVAVFCNTLGLIATWPLNSKRSPASTSPSRDGKAVITDTAA
jgi:hypothetical protein